MIAFLPIGILSSKIGRKKMIIIGIIILAVAFTLGIIANKSTKFLIYVTLSLAGIGWATINVNSYPMIVEMSKGSNVGKYTGFYYTASMSAQIVTPIISGYLMENINLRTLFPYSLFFTLLALVTMMFVKHGDAKKIEQA
jgi:MFS family permease